MGSTGNLRAMEANQNKRGCGWLLLILLLVGVGSTHSGVYACSLSESEVLLSLKDNFSSYYDLTSWKRGSDCCNGWSRVICDTRTQDVIELDLSVTKGSLSADLCKLNMLQVLYIGMFDEPIAFREIPACIWNMTELEHLSVKGMNGSLSTDLCNLNVLQVLNIEMVYKPIAPPIAFRNIPACLWNMTKLERLSVKGMTDSFSADLCNLNMLQYLDITFQFSGKIPACLWNMTELEYLFLRWERGTGDLVLPVDSPVGIRRLRELSLLNTGIRGALPEWIGNLSQLATLGVDDNNITALPSLPMSLESLSAVNNHIREIPSSIGGFRSSLQRIYLNLNFISNIPADVLSNLSQLEILDLSDNQITAIPGSLASVSLTRLDLRSNWINNSGSLGQLPKLISLSLDSNLLTQLPASLSNLSSLTHLSFTDNMITSIPSSIGNLLALDNFNGQGNRITAIPTSFGNLSNLQFLDLSYNNLSMGIPESWSALAKLEYLILAKNWLTGQLPGFLYSETSRLKSLNVSQNQLSGQVQEFRWAEWPGRDLSLDLSCNKFTGPLPSFALLKFKFLLLSNNKFSGSIPLGLANSNDLQALDVSFNQLSGGLPEFLGNCSRLVRLQAGNNSLTGQIPSSLGRIQMLVSLSLHNNFFDGVIPQSLSNLTELIVLDLTQNRLNGTLPSSFQNLPPSLRVFMVGLNYLTGELPSWIVNLTSLQVLDLSNNNFCGKLPRSYSKLQGFIIIGNSTSNIDTLYHDEIQIVAKGLQMKLSSIISVRTSFDVSNNQLTGSIPEKIGELQGLRYLNLSGNGLSGSIPASLSNLSQLESLSLVNNLLTGNIPWELNTMSSLGYFNVSSNQLTGRIPSGPGQICTFDNSSFANNSGLCGTPLPDCHSDSVPMQAPAPAPSRSNGFKDDIWEWILLNGFFIGFSVSFGTVSFIFPLSKKARSYLWVPKRTAKWVYWYKKPYGMYRPKQ